MAHTAKGVLGQTALAFLITRFTADSLQVVSVALTFLAAHRSLRVETAATRHDYASFCEHEAGDCDYEPGDYSVSVAAWLHEGGYGNSGDEWAD